MAGANNKSNTHNTEGRDLLMKSHYIHERSWVGVNENLKINDIVIIPVGAVEQHGAHTAHLVDTCWATAISEGIAELTDTIIAPPIYAGYSPGHMAYPGTITISAKVLADYIVDVAASLMCHGYKKFILINGNRVANLPPMMEAVYRIRMKYGAWAGCLDAGLTAFGDVAKIANSPKGLEHAGDAETSFMLHYRPDLVDMKKIDSQPECPDAEYEEFVAESPIWFPPFYPSNEEKGDSHFTSAHFASAEKGQQILEAIVVKSVNFIKTIKNREVTLKNVEVPA